MYNIELNEYYSLNQVPGINVLISLSSYSVYSFCDYSHFVFVRYVSR